MTEQDAYSTLDITRRFDLPTQRFRMWIDEGFIVPSLQRASGHGTKNLFSHLDVYGIALFRLLVEELKVRREIASQYVTRFIGRKEAETSDHILFRVKGGKLEATTLAPGSWQMDIETASILLPGGKGRVVPEVDEGGVPTMPGKDWDYSILINFKKIRTEVDARL